MAMLTPTILRARVRDKTRLFARRGSFEVRLCFVARRDVHFYGNYVVVFVARNNLKIQSGLPYFRPTAIFLRLKVDDVDTGSGFVQTGDPDDK